MSTLRICLFGSVHIVHDRYTAEVQTTHTVQALLAYLLLHRQRNHPREALAELFWGDSSDERARGCLNTALWRLRRVLEPDGVPRGTYLVTTPAGEVGFNPRSNYWLDVGVFEARATKVLTQPMTALRTTDIEALEAAERLCTGELLDGFFDEWALRERERLRSLHMGSLVYLMRYHKQCGAAERSIAFGQKILEHDPLREEIQRELMRLYVETGQRASAIRQYERCRDTLDRELGIAPMEETQALYHQVTSPRDPERRPPAQARECTTIRQAVQRLQMAMDDFDKARAQLQRAIQVAEQFAESESQRPLSRVVDRR